MSRRPDFVPPDTSKNNTTYVTDLTDAQWQLIEPLLPPPDTSGAPRTTNLRHALNAMLYRSKTGCQWKMLPKDFGIPWETVYNWHEAFARRGTWERVQRVLAARERGANRLGGHPQAACPSLARRANEPHRDRSTATYWSIDRSVSGAGSPLRSAGLWPALRGSVSPDQSTRYGSIE